MRILPFLLALVPALAQAAPDFEVHGFQVNNRAQPIWEIKVDVINHGDDSSSAAICVDLFVGAAQPPQIGAFGDHYECFSQLDTDEIRTVVFYAAPPANGWWDVLLDTETLIAEADENNNQFMEHLNNL